ncbi:MAG: Gfo/Idh/MocA family oxidoreductase [Acidobacteria bacterium]|nr:Gfo/Idh/MocA family oxidoreductase [Acidobacteriota bacterium]
MDTRRNFLGKVTGIAGAVSAAGPAMGANDKIRLGIIGIGDRGTELVHQAMSIPGVEMVAFADVYTRRLEAAKRIAPNAQTYMDHRRLLDDKSIDAVIIATPQHLHCEHFVNTLGAGKHVYQEKTMAFTVDHAKRMRKAFQADGGKHVVQIGHQSCSSGQVADAVDFLKDGKVGKITAIAANMFRNTPHGKPQWSRPVYPDMNPENVLWQSFQGEAPKHDFDANRFINWRFFFDYSGGNVYENMCHQLSFWYKVLDLKVPTSVTMTGGVFLWKDGREVPDTMNVAMQHSEEMLFSWVSGFGNNQLGITEHVLGTDGTIAKGPQIRYQPQKVNRPDGVEITGRNTAPAIAHMQNFIDAMRSSSVKPNCPFDVGYRVSIACRMAVDSYRQGRTLRWDPEKEEVS